MTREQQRGIAEFLRKYIRLMADFNALYSVLDTYESRGETPHKWKSFWEDLQKSNEYQETLKFFEPLIVAVEQVKSDTELIALLYKMSDTRRPN